MEHTYIYGPAPRSTRLMLRLGPSVNTSDQVASPSSRSLWTEAMTMSRSRIILGSLTVACLPSSAAKTIVASSTRSCCISQRGDSGRNGSATRMMTKKKPWKAIGQRHAKDDGSACWLAKPMKVLRGWPSAIKALWMTNIACSESAYTGAGRT